MIEWKWRYLNRFASQRSAMGLPHDHLLIYISGSYGDIYANLAFLRSVYELKKIPIIALISSRWKELVLRFEYPSVKYVFIDDDNDLFQNSLMMEGRSFLLIPGVVFPTLPTLHPYIGEAILTKRMPDYEARRLLLELPVGTPMDFGNLTEERRRYGADILTNAGCRLGKTVVLAFKSNSEARNSDLAQFEAAKFLAKKGFDIIINTAETFTAKRVDNPALESFPTCSIPSDMPIEFVSLAGNYLGTSHGLSVILSTFPCAAKIVLLNDLTHGFVENNGFKIPSKNANITKAFKEDICNLNEIHDVDYSAHEIDKLMLRLDMIFNTN